MTPGMTPPSNITPATAAASTDGAIDAATWRPHRPNILITGTPGVGKTTLSHKLSAHIGLRHIGLSAFATERHLLSTYDAARNAHTMHEDAVLDALEPLVLTGAVILDHHSVDWFPERWPQLVVCLTASTETLFDRLTERGYARSKVEENLQAEIMQVIYEEAVQSYPRLNVLQLPNDTEADMQRNFNTIVAAWNRLINPPDHPGHNNSVDADIAN